MLGHTTEKGCPLPFYSVFSFSFAGPGIPCRSAVGFFLVVHLRGPLVCTLATPGMAVPGFFPPSSPAGPPVLPGAPPDFLCFAFVVELVLSELLPGHLEGDDRHFWPPLQPGCVKAGCTPPLQSPEKIAAFPNLPASFKHWS